MPFYGWCRTLSPLGLALNVRYTFDASLPIPGRVACAVIATLLLVLLTYYVVRVERDYLGVRALFRDATKRLEESRATLHAFGDNPCRYEGPINWEGGAGRAAADCAARGDSGIPPKFGGFPKLPSKEA